MDANKLLKYRVQLLVVAFVVMGYASYIAWGAVNDKNRAIAFSQLEIDGAKTLPAIKELLINTQKLRGLSVSYKVGNSSLLPQVKQQTLVLKSKLEVAQQAVANANLKTVSPLFASLKKKLQKSMRVALSQTKEKGFETYSDVIEDELKLIVKIGDMSNLILDPDLDTYYLMDSVINRLPLLTEAAGKERGNGSSVLISKELNKNTQIELTLLLGSLENNIGALKSGLNSAYSFNSTLKPLISPAFDGLEINAKKLQDEVKKIIRGDFSTDSTDFFQSATDLINSSILLYDLNNKNLLRLLNIRVDKMRVTRNIVFGEGILFLLILLALFYVAYDYLYKNLLIREAAKKEKAILEELKKTNDSLMYALSHDKLTGVYNRSSLLEDIKGFQDGATLMLIDIRAFKEINDVYGNDFGNRVLVKFTSYLKDFFTPMSNSRLYRIGGDEFAVIFTNKLVDTVMQIGVKLKESLRKETFKIDNIRTNLSVKIAINSTSPLLENADLALKAVKKDTNNHILEYKEELSVKKEWQKNMEVITMVKSAIAEDRIVPYFQGIVNLKTMKIEKYEALVRLILPSGEVLSPYFFLDIVSRTHYYYEITEIMIRKTMQVAKTYPQQRFSINFSMKDITNKYIIKILFDLFDADRERAKRIDIELLETELVAVDDSRIKDFLTKVHSYGSKVLIDDFGTGYSNFAYLSDLDVDILKIDASITKEITSDPRKLHILKTIHNFTSGMDMENVAEFVETKEVALLLQELGVEYAQGYYFSKPLPQPLENSEVTIG